MSSTRKTFRAYRCHAFGGYRDLSIDELPVPVLRPTDILIENQAFAIGFPELLMVRGEYQLKPPLPFVPGNECCGIVRTVGSEASTFKVGDYVICTPRIGAYAEIVVTAENNCFHLPRSFDFVTGAAFMAAYKTAYVGLITRGGLQAGETLVVHGASGGVGLAAVELGKHLGARVIATGSDAQKLRAAADKGADHLIDLSVGGFRQRIKTLTDGRGADVIYDPVGGDVFDESMRCIAPLGRILIIGFASGRFPAAPVNQVLIKQISLIGVRAGEYGRQNPAAGLSVHAELLTLATSGVLKPHIHRVFPFECLAEAFAEISSRRVIGRNVVVC